VTAGPGETLIRPELVGLCGTDLEIISGQIDPAYLRYPVVLGHEWTGIVTGESPLAGARVVVEGIVACGHCARCVRGETNLCETYDELGFTRDGAAARLVAVPSVLVHPLAAGVEAEDALLTEPMAVVYRGLARAAPAHGSRVLVIGDGTIALLAVYLLRLWSPAEIVLLGRREAQAELAAQAGAALGLPAAEVVMLRRAALVHDIGMIGIPSGVWDEPGGWSISQRERARTHPYLTERMLARTPLLAQAGHCASLHHERLDGSGYPYGLRGDAISVPARILGAADVYNALRQPRPHRAAVGAGDAEKTMRGEVRAGRLDGDAVNAVLQAAGHRVRRRAGLPAGLTAREADVLVRLGQGRSNPEIAAELQVSRKTVSTHLEHIYTKLGVKTRTEAALFAMRHGLIAAAGEPEPDRKIG
jgi:DNA-binding CsgD family transcriptional regulator